MTRDPNSPWYTRLEAAAYCRVSVRQIDRWRKAGLLHREPGSRVFHRDALDFAVRNNTPNGPAGNLMEPQTNALMGLSASEGSRLVSFDVSPLVPAGPADMSAHDARVSATADQTHRSRRDARAELDGMRFYHLAQRYGWPDLDEVTEIVDSADYY
jgi:hypothetical protein